MENKPRRRTPVTGRADKPARAPYKARRSSGGSKPTDRKPFDRKPTDRKPFADGKPAARKPFADHKPAEGRKPSYGRKPATDRKPLSDRKPATEGRFQHTEGYLKHRRENRERKPAAKVQIYTADDSLRLNRFIANSGICSRREADDFIQAGLVTVNGKIVTELGVKVKPDDDVRFNGTRLKGEKKVYLVMNKPKGYVTTMADPHAEKTVMDLISHDKCPERVYPVGRLDKATTGVLMFTNDGDLADKLTHPAFGARKIYHAFLDKNLKKNDFDAILKGIELEDGEIHADSLSYVDDDMSQVGIEIHSGRNRIVRRIFEHLGYNVRKLDRVYFAGLTKKALTRGSWRFLTDTEIARFKMGQFD
ncbi:MAG: rRNA pseudouridine synthase [Bacteroidales bacterium]|nr:rRNA pseudouridine synthase [Bacteroidales bacterium]